MARLKPCPCYKAVSIGFLRKPTSRVPSRQRPEGSNHVSMQSRFVVRPCGGHFAEALWGTEIMVKVPDRVCERCAGKGEDGAGSDIRRGWRRGGSAIRPCSCGGDGHCAERRRLRCDPRGRFCGRGRPIDLERLKETLTILKDRIAKQLGTRRKH